MSPFRNIVLALTVVLISFISSGNFSFPKDSRWYGRADAALRCIHSDYVRGKHETVVSGAERFIRNFKVSSHIPSVVWLGVDSAKRTGTAYGVFVNALEKFSGYGKEKVLKTFSGSPGVSRRPRAAREKFIFPDFPGVKDQLEFLVKNKALKEGDCGLAVFSREIEFLLRYPGGLLKDFFRLDGEKARVFFNGSGDYHHLSYFLVSKLRAPVTVVVFDAHTDYRETKENAFDCGSWVRELLKLENVKKVILIGIDTDKRDYYGNNSFRFPEGAQMIQKGVTGRVYAGRFRRISLGSLSEPLVIPTEDVYISIDLDCLASEFVSTDWGNGNMTVKEICDIYKKIKSSRRIAGVDVCGIKDPPDLKSLKTLSRLVKQL